MPRLFFRQFAVKAEDAQRRWYLRPFRGLLADRRLTGVRRRSVVAAVAIGLFVAWLPLPGHALIGAASALALRANLIIAAVTTFISNPLTMAPMFYCAYRVGRAMLQAPAQPWPGELSWQWLLQSLGDIWQPLWLGSLVLASASAAIGYVVLNVVWRGSVVAAMKARQLRRSLRHDRGDAA